jgi:transposase-like protein
MVLAHEAQHPSRRAMILSIAAKIGCTRRTLNAWVKQAERENRELRQADAFLRAASECSATALQRSPHSSIPADLCRALRLPVSAGCSTVVEARAFRLTPAPYQALRGCAATDSVRWRHIVRRSGAVAN